MATYSFIHRNNFFDLTLPKSVVEVCNLLKIGECGKFSFLETSDSESEIMKQYMRVRTRLIVKKLEDGSLNLTNSVSDTIGNHGNSEEDKPKTKNVYIVNQPREGAAQRDKVSQSEVAPVVDEAAEDDRIRCAMKEEPREVEDADNDAGLLDHNYTEADGNGTVDKHLKSLGDLHTMEIEDQMGQVVVITPHDHPGTENRTKRRKLHSSISKALAKSELKMSTRHYDKDSPHCPICNTLCKDKYNLMRHLKRVHPADERHDEEIERLRLQIQEKCPQCEHMFCNRKTLIEHRRNVHQNFMGVQCPHCVKKYRTKNHLRMHVKYAHMRADKGFACDQCSSRFDTKRIMTTHKLYHHANLERTMKCDLCEFKYAFQKQYYEHRSRVHDPKKEICPHCGYKCATRWYMNKHMVGCNKARMKDTLSVKREALNTVQTHPVYVMENQNINNEVAANGQVIANGQLLTDRQVLADTGEQVVFEGQIISEGQILNGGQRSSEIVNEFAPHEVTDALVQIENRELVGSEVSETVVELPTMWDLQPADTQTIMQTIAQGSQQVAIDTIVQDTPDIVMESMVQESVGDGKQMVVVKHEEAVQQFAIMGPDGTHHIVQLMCPSST